MADVYDDLEIGLHHHHSDNYLAILRYRRPGEETDHTPVQGIIQIDKQALLEHQAEPKTYGKKLTQSLFASQPLRDEFAQCRAVTESNNRKMRLRLYIDGSASTLHSLRWELLRDPADEDQRLITNDQFLFSRFLTSADWRSVKLHPKGDLRALVVIANPDGLDEYPDLTKIEVDDELQRAQDSLDSMFAKSIVSDPATQTRVTIKHIMDALGEGYDILYLVCHGKLKGKNPGPNLWLEKDEGGVEVVAGAELVSGLRDLDSELRPRLIVLASCQSASDGHSIDEGALSALGPLLAQSAAIPAVIAMQGNVKMDTVASFMPVFFEKLADRGHIDQAMTTARAAVVNQDDWWSPTLYMRLRNGRIWYEPRIAGVQDGLDTWKDLLAAIRAGRCTPILGPNLLNFLMGSPQEIASRWATEAHFPMAPHNIRSLPQVARYVATMESPALPPSVLTDHFRKELLRRHPHDLNNAPANAELSSLIKLVGEKHRQVDEAEPYRVLAHLPAKIYINANPDKLLIHALKEAGKDPQVAICPWHDYIDQPASALQSDPNYRPSVQQPLVYYLFGLYDQPDSLVISEDDYFDFLIWVSKDRTRGDQSLIPHSINRAWSGNALMFLGFQADDWAFRVVLHSITNPDAGRPPKRHKSVAVQINPEEGPFLEPELAAEYVKKYLGDFRERKSSIYWGSAEDFISELWERRNDAETGGWLV